MAVPKNQQKQMMSRERDVRRMPGWRDRLLPRSVLTQELDESDHQESLTYNVGSLQEHAGRGKR